MLATKFVARVLAARPFAARSRPHLPPQRLSPQSAVIKPKQHSEQTLARVLDTELRFEQGKYKEFTEGNAFLKQEGFVLAQSSDSAIMMLRRVVGKVTVEIKYKKNELIRNTEEIKAMQEEEKKKGAKKITEEERLQRMFHLLTNFIVVVKAKDGSGLIFGCTSHQTDLRVRSVIYSKDVEGVVKEMGKLTNKYLGPSFEMLEAPLQEALVSYLQWLGLSRKLMAYIDCSAIDNSKRHYMRWMDDVKKYVGGSQN